MPGTTKNFFAAIFSRSTLLANGRVPQGLLQSKASVRKQFFSEEKNQKTFPPGAHGKIPAMASIVGAAEK
jgi:hypothetical protein